MPLYLGTIHKYLVGNLPASGWVNTYHINAATEDDAMGVLRQAQNIEAACHWSNVQFDRLTIRLANVSASSGIQEPVAETGARDATDEQFLPLFCTVRAVCTDGVNRPDQKYLRLPINENEQDMGVIDTSLITFLTANYCAPLNTLSGIVSSNGAPYISVAVVPAVQNRQRGWHRRTRPGFVRGWVPV